MTQRYNVPAIHTATFSATLTENFSHRPFLHAPFQSRRSQSVSYRHSRLFAGIPTQLTISAQDLYTGVFVYSITVNVNVNGTILASKKFIIIK